MGGKVRVVARIKSDLNKNGESFDEISNSKPWISVSRPDPESDPNLRPSRVKISFGSDQTSSGKQGYEVDECYEQDVVTKEIYSKEIEPLITGLFKGQNSTVFAYGPRGSGKTYTIQGCEDDFGLAVFAVDAMLPQAEGQGKVITVSVFEVYQDRVSDILDAARPEVSVFEDAQGKIRLKGLSKNKISSTVEFQRLYLQAANMRKHQSHIGCIVHVVSPQTDKSSAQLMGKINFIDLASYEDSRRKSSDGFNLNEATRINKSLYAVHNVLYALNAREARVPYRESKLTRMLQDSLGGTSRIVMITCMNPSLCQETVQTVNLASRSCMAGFLACLDPGKSIRSATKTIGMSSPQVLKSASKFNIRSSLMSPRVVKPVSSASASGKIQAGSKSHSHMSIRKAKNVPVEVKGRKLFANASNLKKSELGNKCAESASAQKEVSLSIVSETASSTTQQEEESVAAAFLEVDSSQLLSEKGKSSQTACSDMDSSLLHPEEDVQPVVNSIVPASVTYETPPTGNFFIQDKENKSSLANGASPPLSSRLRDLHNSLKALCFSTEANLKIAQDSSNLVDQVIDEDSKAETPKHVIQDISEFITPIDKKAETPKHVNQEISEFKTPFNTNARGNKNYELNSLASPWENFQMRNSGMKDSLVQEYLKFLNTANKEELKGLKGIGEKRATYILQMREESPQPFKQLDDLESIGLTAKQIKDMVKTVVGELFV